MVRQAGFSAHVERLTGDYRAEAAPRPNKGPAVEQEVGSSTAPRRQESSSLPARQWFGAGTSTLTDEMACMNLINPVGFHKVKQQSKVMTHQREL